MRTRAAVFSVVVAVIAIISATAVAVTALVRGETTRNIVERSPCVIDPASAGCQTAKRESDRAQNLRDACIQPRNYMTPAAFRALTRCPQPARGASRGRPDEDDAVDLATPGMDGRSDAPSPGGDPGAVDPGDAGQAPAPPGDDDGPPPDDGGGDPDPGPGGGGTPPPDEPTLGDQVGDVVDSATAPVTDPACTRLPRTCELLGLP